MIRRNDEISLLYEKIKLLEQILRNGEQAYDRNIKTMKKNQIEMEKLRKENQNLKKHSAQVQTLKQEISLYKEDLMREQAKLNAIENDHLKLIHIHRWHDMQIRDPTKYDLIVKINCLQKYLISKCEQITYLQLKFLEKDRLFFDLTKYFSRRIISDEEGMIIFKYKASLRNKTKKIKVKLCLNYLFKNI